MLSNLSNSSMNVKTRAFNTQKHADLTKLTWSNHFPKSSSLKHNFFKKKSCYNYHKTSIPSKIKLVYFTEIRKNDTQSFVTKIKLS